MTKQLPKIIALAALLASMAITASGIAQTPQSQPAKPSAGKSKTGSGLNGHGAALAKEANASKSTSQTASAYSGPPVLDPSNFYGSALVGYAAAKAAPDVLAQLFCYCGCDITDKHKRLIDCFTSNHGTDCHICQEEATLALKLHRQETAVGEIQKQVDEQYAHDYPFQEESATLKQYKASRLWKNEAQPQDGKASGPSQSFSDPKANRNTEKIAGRKVGSGGQLSAANDTYRVKPGFHVGSCCAAESGN